MWLLPLVQGSKAVAMTTLRDFRLAIATMCGIWVIFVWLGDSPWQALRRLIHGRPYG